MAYKWDDLKLFVYIQCANIFWTFKLLSEPPAAKSGSIAQIATTKWVITILRRPPIWSLPVKFVKKFSGRTCSPLNVMSPINLEADEYCPHCDNRYVLDAVTKEDRWSEFCWLFDPLHYYIWNWIWKIAVLQLNEVLIISKVVALVLWYSILSVISFLYCSPLNKSSLK